MIPHRLRSATACCLALLLGVLNTGLPSHSHETERPATGRQLVIGADHHAHGTLLVEQAERVQSALVQLAVPAAGIAAALFFPPVPSVAVEHGTPLRPSERAPPSTAPRAPPQLI